MFQSGVRFVPQEDDFDSLTEKYCNQEIQLSGFAVVKVRGERGLKQRKGHVSEENRMDEISCENRTNDFWQLIGYWDMRKSLVNDSETVNLSDGKDGGDSKKGSIGGRFSLWEWEEIQSSNFECVV